MLALVDVCCNIWYRLIAICDFESAVTLLLATPPNNPLFYMDALRAVSLASAVSTGLHELAVKVR